MGKIRPNSVVAISVAKFDSIYTGPADYEEFSVWMLDEFGFA